MAPVVTKEITVDGEEYEGSQRLVKLMRKEKKLRKQVIKGYLAINLNLNTQI